MWAAPADISMWHTKISRSQFMLASIWARSEIIHGSQNTYCIVGRLVGIFLKNPRISCNIVKKSMFWLPVWKANLLDRIHILLQKPCCGIRIFLFSCTEIIDINWSWHVSTVHYFLYSWKSHLPALTQIPLQQGIVVPLWFCTYSELKGCASMSGTIF